MQNKTYLARCAGPAIAAVLALGSTPLLAQDAQAPGADVQPARPVISPAPAEPVLQLPVDPAPVPTAAATPNAATAAPTVRTATPAQGTARTVSTPVVQAVPVEPAAPETPVETPSNSESNAAPAAANSSSQAAAPASSAARNNATRPAATAAPTTTPAAETSAPVEGQPETVLPPPRAIPPLPVAADSAPVTMVDETGIEESTETAGWIGLLLSALAVIGLGILATIIVRSRRKIAVPMVERPKVERPVAAKPVDVAPATVTSSAKASAAAPVMAAVPREDRKDEARAAPRDIREWAQPEPSAPATPAPALRGSEKDMANAGAAIALPKTAPENAAEREALVQRMVAAQPDRANPFRSRKARARRARLILQSLDRTFTNGSRIDLSQYPVNWPELSRKDYPSVA